MKYIIMILTVIVVFWSSGQCGFQKRLCEFSVTTLLKYNLGHQQYLKFCRHKLSSLKD